MSKSLIKELAYTAKLRMTNSNYTEKTKSSNNIINFTPTKIQKNQILVKKLDTSREEILKQRILSILENNFDCTNPIALIIDHNYYNSLNDDSKQKYILELSKIYTETKNEYINAISLNAKNMI